MYGKSQKERMDNLDQANQEIDRLRKQLDKLQVELQGKYKQREKSYLLLNDKIIIYVKCQGWNLCMLFISEVPDEKYVLWVRLVLIKMQNESFFKKRYIYLNSTVAFVVGVFKEVHCRQRVKVQF